MRSRSLALSFPSLLLTLSGCLAEDGLSAPDDCIEDASGVFTCRRDNPTLRGAVYVQTASEDGPGGIFVDRRTIAPDVAYLEADMPALFEADSSDRGWLWSEAGAGAITVGAPAFLAPAFRLPVDFSSVEVTLVRRDGRTLDASPPPGTIPPPIGFDTTELDAQQIELDPNVLVLPVRVTMFVEPSGALPGGFPPPPLLSQWIDPGQVATTSVTSVDTGFDSATEVHSGRFNADGTATYAGTPPDNLWTQCDIQFRAVEIEVIEQQLGLQDTLVDNCLCQIPEETVQATNPVTEYVSMGRNGSDMLQIFIGGTIGTYGCPFGGFAEIAGFTCGAPNHDAFCPADVDGDGEANVMFVDGSLIGAHPNVIAHELGHILGLGHTSENDCVGDPTAGGDNLMTTGGNGPVLTEAQCGRARCIALQWLEAYGMLPPGHATVDCE